MGQFNLKEISDARKEIAMSVAGIFDPEEVDSIEPISYVESLKGKTYLTVWLFGNKKVHSTTFEAVPGVYEDVTQAIGWSTHDAYRFKNISNLTVDQYGCVISLSDGKKLELKSTSLEGPEDFLFSARGLETLWDEYDN